MNYIKVFLFLLLFSCSNDFYYHECNSDVSNYTNFKYEFINRKLIKIISGDSVFSADVIINRNTKDTIFLDSVLCYCLAICKKESLGNSRFYRDIKGYEVVKKHKISEFNDRKDINTYNDNSDFYKYVIASVKVDKFDKNWKSYLTLDNMTTPSGWRLPPTEGKYIEEKLKLK